METEFKYCFEQDGSVGLIIGLIKGCIGLINNRTNKRMYNDYVNMV